MSAKQGVTRVISNPEAKYKVNYIRYRIYNGDGTYTNYGKKYITRKNDEWIDKEN